MFGADSINVCFADPSPSSEGFAIVVNGLVFYFSSKCQFGKDRWFVNSRSHRQKNRAAHRARLRYFIAAGAVRSIARLAL